MSAVFIASPHTEAATLPYRWSARIPVVDHYSSLRSVFTHHVCRIRHIMGFYLSALPKLPHEQKPHVQIFTPVDHSNRVAVTGLILFNCLHKEYRDVCAALILTLTVGSFTTDDFFVSCVILNGTKRFDSLSPPPSVTTVEASRAKEDGEKMVIFFLFISVECHPGVLPPPPRSIQVQTSPRKESHLSHLDCSREATT